MVWDAPCKCIKLFLIFTAFTHLNALWSFLETFQKNKNNVVFQKNLKVKKMLQHISHSFIPTKIFQTLAFFSSTIDRAFSYCGYWSHLSTQPLQTKLLLCLSLLSLFHPCSHPDNNVQDREWDQLLDRETHSPAVEQRVNWTKWNKLN